MAKKQGVWGIDIGLVAIKALRCLPGDNPNELVADRFDYIEFPKMLNQPEAEPEQMVREALEQFLSRNEVKGDKVAMSVPGNAGLSRFFRPPPVEAQTLPDIVKYEVKQQIPFPIEDVVWDWQQMGGTVVEDRIVDAEVGIFAMKREAVYRALKPFDEVGVEVDLVQLSPLAIFNYVLNDVLEQGKSGDGKKLAGTDGGEESRDFTVVIAMGTEATDLIVTNGTKFWQRNMPLGGNRFTKQLSRELKLTHAKAEQLKRNARQAEDPKQIFKAMQPVFVEFVNEVQRSLAFFQGLEKNSKFSQIVLLGNSANLPGLRSFLNKQLELDLVKLSDFRHLKGAEVLSDRSFQENSLSFATVYGLCLQGLNKAHLKVNLLPTEIRVARIIRAKKPWVLASLSLLMLGLLVGYRYKQVARYEVSDDFRGRGSDVTWKRAKDEGATKVSLSRTFVTSDREQKARLEKLNQIAGELAVSAEGNAKWIELTSAIVQALPRDPRIVGDQPVDANSIPYEDRQVLYLDHVETKYEPSLDAWFAEAKPVFDSQFEISVPAAGAAAPAAGGDAAAAAPAGGEAASGAVEGGATEGGATEGGATEGGATEGGGTAETPAPAEGSTAAAGGTTGGEAAEAESFAPIKVTAPDKISGPGYLVEIRGHHYHNSDKASLARNAGKIFLVRTLINQMLNGELELPGGEAAGGGKFRYSDFGILLPTIIQRTGMAEDETIVLDDSTNPNSAMVKPRGSGQDAAGGGSENKSGAGSAPAGGAGNRGDGRLGPPPSERERGPESGAAKPENSYKVRRFNFIVQFVWVPRTPAERIKARAERLAKEQGTPPSGESAPAGPGGPAGGGTTPAAAPPPAAPPADDED